MFGIPEAVFVPFVSILGMVLLGVLGALGKRYGESRPTPAERSLEIAGAIVDNRKVEMLAAAIEASNIEAMQLRATLKTVSDAAMSMSREIEELRRSLNDLGKEIARKH